MNKQIVIRKTDCDGIGNVLKGFISAYSVYDNTVIECNKNYVFGNYDKILNSKHIYNIDEDNEDNIKNIEYFYTCRLMVLKEEEKYQQHIPNEFFYSDRGGNSFISNLFSDSVLIDWNYDESKISYKVKNRILKTIKKISFNDTVTNEYNLIKNKIKNIGILGILGISIRTWKSSHEKGIDRLYSSSIYKEKIKEVLVNNLIDCIVLSFDNNDYIEEYTSYISTLPNISNKQIYILNNIISHDLDPLQKVIIKILLLSDCKHFIANRISTFSEIIFWFSMYKFIDQIVYPLF
jgi:hypothetical protein